MSDLSRLLDDIYQSDAATPAAKVEPPTEPSWSSDDALDEAFANWVPGPDEHSTSAERSMFDFDHVDEPEEPGPAFNAPVDPAPAFSAPEPPSSAVDGFDMLDPVAASLAAAVVVPEPIEAPTAPAQPTPAIDESEVAAPEPAPVEALTWSLEHDDILPTRGLRRRARLSLRR